MSSFNPDGTLDTHTGRILVFLGKKNSGKSVLAEFIFRSFPGDKIVVDVAGDDGPMGPGVHEIRGTVATLAMEWPEYLRVGNRPMILRYVPDDGSPTLLEDIDAVIGMAVAHSSKERPTMILVQETNIAVPVGQTKPHMRTLLNSNRHHGVTALFCAPRAKRSDILVLAQADLIFVFQMPSWADQLRVAETIGWDPRAFGAAVDEVEGHEFLRYDANEAKPPLRPEGADPDVWADQHPDWRLVHQEALPAGVVAATKQWAAHVPEPV